MGDYTGLVDSLRSWPKDRRRRVTKCERRSAGKQVERNILETCTVHDKRVLQKIESAHLYQWTIEMRLRRMLLHYVWIAAEIRESEGFFPNDEREEITNWFDIEQIARWNVQLNNINDFKRVIIIKKSKVERINHFSEYEWALFFTFTSLSSSIDGDINTRLFRKTRFFYCTSLAWLRKSRFFITSILNKQTFRLRILDAQINKFNLSQNSLLMRAFRCLIRICSI